MAATRVGEPGVRPPIRRAFGPHAWVRANTRFAPTLLVAALLAGLATAADAPPPDTRPSTLDPPRGSTGSPRPELVEGRRLEALREVNEAKLRAVIAELSGGGPRLSGYPRNDELADWLADRFRKIGLRNVETMPFSVAVPVQKHAYLEVGSRQSAVGSGGTGFQPVTGATGKMPVPQDTPQRIPLHAVWPNLVRTSTMPKGGATGELIYAGDGHLHRLNGREVRGSIVLLDFNSRGRWESAAMLGAAACVFIGTHDLAAGELRNKYYDVPLDMPRFWVDEAHGKRLRELCGTGSQPVTGAAGKMPVPPRKPVMVTLKARVVWEQLLTRNVYGFIEGTDPDVGRELMVVEAYYDAVSVIPTLAPGAQQGCSLAAMLAMAEYFVAHPPKRSMMFLASSGHAQGVAGVRHFFDAFDRKVADLNTDLAEATKTVVRLERLREALRPIEDLEAHLAAVRAAVGAVLRGLAGDDLGRAWLVAAERVERVERSQAAGAPPEQVQAQLEAALSAAEAVGRSESLPMLHHALVAAAFARTPFARAIAPPALPPGESASHVAERLSLVMGEYERAKGLVTAREGSDDPAAVFGGDEVAAERGWMLMKISVVCVAVLVAVFFLTRERQQDEGGSSEEEPDGSEEEDGSRQSADGSQHSADDTRQSPPGALPRIRAVLAFLFLGCIALGVVAAVYSLRELEPSFALSLRPELLHPAAFGSAAALLFALVLVGSGRLQRAVREALVGVGLIGLIAAAVAAEAHWFLVVLVVVVPGLFAVAPFLLGRRPGWLVVRNLVFFLALGLASVLQATFWSAAWKLPVGALPGVGLVLTLVLLCPDATVARARQMVMGVALSFALLFLVGLGPQKKEAEADVLRGQMVERLRDPMRLRAEAHAKTVYRLRTAKSQDEARIQELDSLRLRYKRLSWRDGYDELTDEEADLFGPAVGDARRDLAFRLRYNRREVEVLRGKLRLAARLAQYETEVYEEKPEKGVYMFVGLELSSKTSQLGAFREGWLYRLPGARDVVDMYSPLAERLEGIARELETHRDFATAEVRAGATYLTLQKHERIYQDVMRGKRGRPWHTYIPRMGLSGEVASLAGVPGVTFTTLNDERHRVDSPADTIEHVHFANLVTQSRFLIAMVDEMANDPGLVGLVRFKSGFGRVKGKLTMELSGRRLPDQPVPKAMALLYRGWWQPLTGQRRRLAQLTGPDGEFEYTGIANRPRARWRWMRVDGYGLDPDDGRITMAVNRAMLRKYPNDFRNNDPKRWIRPVLFDCEAVALYNLFDQRYFQQLWGIRVLDARRESTPIRYGYDKWWINGVLYLEPLTPLKFIMAPRLRGVRLVLLNASKEHPEGVGYKIDDLRREPLVPLLVARDFSHLVEHRLGVLEKRGIQNQRLRELHEQAKGYLAEAEKHLEARQYDRAIDAARSAWAYESRAYPDVQATINDTVAGLLFYVALLLPFAYCVERLFFSLSRVTTRAAATAGVMAACIAVLWQIHPAFQLSNNPFIVILAFFLLALGGLTLVIIVARFEDEMRKMERQRSGIEVADVSRMSAFGAAFALGIANMRRRKVRTALTATTLIILTFAIMSFTSTRTRHVEREQAITAQPTYKGVLVRRKVWASMSGLVYGTLYDKYRTQAIVAPRIWRGPQRQGEASYIDLRSADGRRKFTVKSLLGLCVDERRMLSGELLGAGGLCRGDACVATTPVMGATGKMPVPQHRKLLEVGRWFEKENANEILVPRRVAQALGVRDEDVGKAQVQLFGIEFTVVGIYSGETFESFLDLNGEPVSPVDWSVEQEAADQEKEAAAEAESETGEDTRELQYIHVPADEMAILPYMTLWTLGGSLRSVAVAFDPAKMAEGRGTRDEQKDPLIRALGPERGDTRHSTLDTRHSALRRQSIAHMRRHLKDRLTLTLYFGDEQGVYKFTAADVPSFQGLRNVFVPLVIAFLIVLNTMLGSVHERMREVGIYSSVGLAPGHISMLFIAEAMGLATMSAVAGYLISQTVVKVLFTAGWMNMEHMFLNYSSMATVGSLLLVVLMVLASTAYPAHMVSKVASPDIERRWSLPPVHGDRIGLRLPYSLNHHDVPGLMLFLHNYIRAHEEISLGVFCVRDVRLTLEDGRIIMTFSAWLAPYDLGVYQEVIVTSSPAEDEGHDNATVTIDRQSGEAGAWKRNNQTFLNQLRKQFLIWRAIGPGGRERYVKEARGRFGIGGQPEEATES